MLNLQDIAKENNPTYAVYLTMEEIMLAEEALFERSAVLAAIADMNVYKKDTAKGEVLDKKVIKIENIAKKIAMPLDEMYMANEGLASV
jgi:hypothetical protein